jgi:hypothetical protein
VSLVLVVHLLLLDLIFEVVLILLKVILLIVEFVLQRKEMLIEGDAISEEGFITACFVLLIYLSVFQQLYLMFHQHYLLLHV